MIKGLLYVKLYSKINNNFWCIKMQQDDFFELFFSNLRKEVMDDEFVDSFEKLIKEDKFNKVNYLKAIVGDLK